MPFDIEAARKYYNDEEILNGLSSKYNFDLEKARSSGWSDKDILNHLSNYKGDTEAETLRETTYGAGFALDMATAAKDYFEKLKSVKGETYYPAENVFPPGSGVYPSTPQNRQMLKDLAAGTYKHGGREAILFSGLMAGGAIGSGSGPVGTVAGAGLGYAQTKKAVEIAENFVKKLSGEQVDYKDLKGESIATLNDFIEGANIEMGGQVVGKVATGVINKIFAPKASRMTPSRTAMRDLSREQGIELSPAAVTESKQYGLIEMMMEKSPSSADVVNDWIFKKQINPLMLQREQLLSKGNMTAAQLTDISKNIHKEVTNYLKTRTNLKGAGLERLRGRVMARLGTDESAYNVGMSVQEKIAYNSERVRVQKDEMYSKVGEYLPEGDFETPNLNAVAKKLIAETKKLPEKAPTWLNWSTGEVGIKPKLMKQLESLPAQVREEILAQMKAEAPDLFTRRLDWSDMQAARRILGDRARGENLSAKKGMNIALQTTPEGRIYYALKQALEKDMRLIAESSGSKAKETLDLADAFFKENVQGVFRADVIRKIAASDPGKVIDVAFKPNAIRDLNIVKKALGRNQFLELRNGFTKRILGEGEFDSKFLKRNLNRYGNDFLSNVYLKPELDYLNKIAKQGENLLSVKLPSDKIIKTIGNTYPDTVADAVIGAIEAKPQSHIVYRNVKALRRVLSQEQFEGLGDLFMSKLFRLNQTSDLLSPVTFAKTVSKYDQRGVLRSFFPYQKVEQLRNLAEVGKQLNYVEAVAGNPSGTGQTIMTWGSLGMMFRNPVKGTMIVITPRLMSKFWYSDFGIKYLTDGFKLPASSEAGMALATKISLILNSESEDKNVK